MTQVSYPDPTIANVVTDVKYEALMSAIVGDGLYGSPTDPPVVFGDSTGLQIKVRANSRGALRGFGWQVGGVDDVVEVTANSSGNPRIDRVVLQLDRSIWRVRAVVKTGMPAGTPVKPTLQRDLDAAGAGSGKFEIPFGTVAVASGALTIRAIDVTPEAYYNAPQGVACTSMTRPPHAPALSIFEVDTGDSYTSTGTAWASPTQDSGWVTVPYASGWNSAGVANRVRKVNGVVYLQFQANRSGGNLAAGTNSAMGTIPAGYRPDGKLAGDSYSDGGQNVRWEITTAGVISVINYPSPINTGSDVTVPPTDWPM